MLSKVLSNAPMRSALVVESIPVRNDYQTSGSVYHRLNDLLPCMPPDLFDVDLTAHDLFLCSVAVSNDL